MSATGRPEANAALGGKREAQSNERDRRRWWSRWSPRSCRRRRCSGWESPLRKASPRGLEERGYLDPGSAVTPFATPRRLAVAVTHVRGVAPDAEVIDKLMPAKVALDASGKPSEALIGRSSPASDARNSPTCARQRDGRARRHSTSPPTARPTMSICGASPRVSRSSAACRTRSTRRSRKLPIPKVMSYAGAGGYYNDVKFVRPARRLLALHGADVVPVAVLGLAADRVTTGHRFRSRDGIRVATAEAYEETLRAEGKVVASFAARRALIVAGLRGAAADATVIMPEALLDEVTALVESPAVYEGAFDPAFLAVPQECLILTMQQNQKYFALAGSDGRLVPRFLVVSNLETADPARDRRRQRARAAGAPGGCAILLRPGPEGAARGARAAPRLDRLSQQARDAARSRRPGSRTSSRDARRDDRRGSGRESARAAQLAKADLTTDMVGEFPELQGLMGRYYARARPRIGRGRGGDRAALLAALRGRRASGGPGGAGGRARRQARNARRHVRHRRAADRRQGSVRPAPPRDRRDPHRGREGAARDASPTSSMPRSARSRVCPPSRMRGRSSRTSSTSGCAATCAKPATRRTRSRR